MTGLVLGSVPHHDIVVAAMAVAARVEAAADCYSRRVRPAGEQLLYPGDPASDLGAPRAGTGVTSDLVVGGRASAHRRSCLRKTLGWWDGNCRP